MMYPQSEDTGFGFLNILLPLVTTAVSAGTQLYTAGVAKSIAGTQAKYGALSTSISERASAMLAAQGLISQQAKAEEAALAPKGIQIGGIQIPLIYLLIGGGGLLILLLLRRR